MYITQGFYYKSYFILLNYLLRYNSIVIDSITFQSQFHYLFSQKSPVFLSQQCILKRCLPRPSHRLLVGVQHGTTMTEGSLGILTNNQCIYPLIQQCYFWKFVPQIYLNTRTMTYLWGCSLKYCLLNQKVEASRMIISGKIAKPIMVHLFNGMLFSSKKWESSVY